LSRRLQSTFQFDETQARSEGLTMAHTFSLRLPYAARLDAAINPGQSLIVRGQPTGDRFDINLANGPDSNTSNIILHMSCRLKEKEYVFNSKQNGQWGKEERHKLHLAKGTPFSIRIRCHESKFEVTVDGKELCEYHYRTPIVEVTHVDISGELTLNAVGWEGNYYSVPYKVGIPGNFDRGRKLFLTLEPNDELFAVNFMAGSDIAFHFNPRFNKKHTVNNSCMGGSWGKEEIVTAKWPFEKKKSADLVFVSENDQYGVYVNGEPYCTFVHRIDPHKIDGLEITGKMDLQVVHVE